MSPIEIPKKNKDKEKTKFIDIFLSLLDLFNTDDMLAKFDPMYREPVNTKYSILIRVCYGSNVIFKMLGVQYTFRNSYDPIVMKDRVKELSEVIIYRLKVSMDEYDYNREDINTIHLVVYRVDPIPELTKTPYNYHLSELDNSEKDLLDTAKYKLELAFKKLIPLAATMDEKLYNNLVLIPHRVPETSGTVLDPQEIQESESEVQGKEVVNEELSATTVKDPEHSQKNDHQSALDLITSVNPNTVLDSEINLYNDTGGKYIVSIQKEQIEKIAHNSTILTYIPVKDHMY